MGKYFGTDGIRGKALIALDEKIAFRVGQGLSKAFSEKQVIIAHDTRQSSQMLAYIVAYGALSQGLHVMFAGVCATPMLANYAKVNQMTGIMITASHNPYTDNGIKVFNKGYKTTPSEEEVIEKIIEEPLTDIKTFGHFELANDLVSTYLMKYNELPSFKSKLSIVYDSANGANFEIAKKLFDQYATDAVQINNKPDGLNINVNCGSTHMDVLQAYVKKHQFDLGVGFDGDGDRVLVCDQYRIYDGDEIIYVIARYLKSVGKLKDNHVVLTKMSNPGLLKAMRQDGMSYSLTDVGDKYVTAKLLENEYGIGGEISGHIIINAILHTGDGLLAAIYLLYVLLLENKSIGEILSPYKRYPYRLENIQNVDISLLKDPDTIVFLESIQEELGEDALLLVRPSGTEPLLRVTVSHEDEAVVNRTIQKIISYMNKRSE